MTVVFLKWFTFVTKKLTFLQQIQKENNKRYPSSVLNEYNIKLLYKKKYYNLVVPFLW